MACRIPLIDRRHFPAACACHEANGQEHRHCLAVRTGRQCGPRHQRFRRSPMGLIDQLAIPRNGDDRHWRFLRLRGLRFVIFSTGLFRSIRAAASVASSAETSSGTDGVPTSASIASVLQYAQTAKNMRIAMMKRTSTTDTLQSAQFGLCFEQRFFTFRRQHLAR